MINYNGIKSVNKVYHIMFSNEKGATAMVPIDQATAHRITSYLSRIAPGGFVAPAERYDEELPDDT